MRKVFVLVALALTACASRPPLCVQEVRTESVCVGQQTVVRYRDFTNSTPAGDKICPPIYVITGNLCGR